MIPVRPYPSLREQVVGVGQATDAQQRDRVPGIEGDDGVGGAVTVCVLLSRSRQRDAVLEQEDVVDEAEVVDRVVSRPAGLRS